MSLRYRPLLFFALAWLLFALASAVPRLLAETAFESTLQAHRWLPHAIVKTLLIAFSVVAILRTGRGMAAYGFRAPEGYGWIVATMGGVVLGACATGLIVLTPAKGMTWIMRDLGLAGMILWVWFYSSFSEELFTRGWFQSELAVSEDRSAAPARRSLSAPVVASGLLFGSLHLSLLWSEADLWTVVIIVTFTTLLGLLCAWARQRWESLVPPLAVHVGFNVGGFIGGIVITILLVLLTGDPPRLDEPPR